MAALLFVVGFVRGVGQKDVEFAAGAAEVGGVGALDTEGFECVLDVLRGGARGWVEGLSGFVESGGVTAIGNDVTFLDEVIIAQQDLTTI